MNMSESKRLSHMTEITDGAKVINNVIESIVYDMEAFTASKKLDEASLENIQNVNQLMEKLAVILPLFNSRIRLMAQRRFDGLLINDLHIRSNASLAADRISYHVKSMGGA